MRKNILFVTTLNLATNPRLFKEARLALDNGFEVEIVCFEFNNWSYHNNQLLKDSLKGAIIHNLPAGRNHFFKWFSSVVSEKLCRMIQLLIPLPLPLLSQAISRRSWLLNNELSKIKSAGIVVGHNPGAFWPAMKFAKEKNCRLGFDVEDYHPGEGRNTLLSRLNTRLLKRSLPHADYVSYASSMIKMEVEKYVDVNNFIGLTLLNYFSAAEFCLPKKNDGLLSFIWFSQNISHNRGLELVIPVFEKYAHQAILHLYGNLNTVFYREWLKDRKGIKVHNPLPQLKLHESLGQYDIGLALEPGKDLNNQLALSNKLLAYMQAGLYVVATKTIAQENFLSEYKDHGQIFEPKELEFENLLSKLILIKEEIRSFSEKRYHNFKFHCWETASNLIKKTWTQLI
jgi:hypothetical protein